MKLIQVFVILLATLLFSASSFARIYRCTDAKGNVAYQAISCPKEGGAAEFNINTRGVTDLSIKPREKELALELKKQQETKARATKANSRKSKTKKDAEKQSTLTTN